MIAKEPVEPELGVSRLVGLETEGWRTERSDLFDVGQLASATSLRISRERPPLLRPSCLPAMTWLIMRLDWLRSIVKWVAFGRSFVNSASPLAFRKRSTRRRGLPPALLSAPLFDKSDRRFQFLGSGLRIPRSEVGDDNDLSPARSEVELHELAALIFQRWYSAT